MKYGLEIGLGIVGLLTLASFPLIASIPSDTPNPNLTPIVEVAEIDTPIPKIPTEEIETAVEDAAEEIADSIDTAYDVVEEISEPAQEENYAENPDSTVLYTIPITVYDGYYGQTADRPLTGYGIDPNLRTRSISPQQPEEETPNDTIQSPVQEETPDTPSEQTTENTPTQNTTTPAVDVTNSSAPIVETTTEEIKKKVIAKYELLPEDIQNHFENNDWTIHITSEKVVQEENLFSIPIPGSIIAGLTIPYKSSIYLTDKVSDQSMNHEMGHYVDMVMLGEDGSAPSNSQEFIDIYNREKANFGDDDYPQSDSHEYFAETFCMYIEYAGDLKDKFPMTYQYMDNLISPYGGTKTNGVHMTEAEKDERKKNTIAEGFDFDGIYGEMLKELGREIVNAIKSNK